MTAAITLIALALLRPASPERPVTIIAVGDICLAGSVERSISAHGDAYPFEHIRSAVAGADIAFCNLECCLAVGGAPLAKRFTFRGRPARARALKSAGFDIVSLANNHAWDYGKPAIRETVDAVRRAGLLCAGAGADLADAHALRIITVRGKRVGFLAYLGMFPALLPMRAREPAIAMGPPDVVSREVAAARRQVDFLIVSIHAGVERSKRPSARQRAIAQAAVDAGADVVLGHHPHVMQPMETYRGKPIFYSLGNCVFPVSAQMASEGGKGWMGMAVIRLRSEAAPEGRLIELELHAGRPGLPRHRRAVRHQGVAH